MSGLRRVSGLPAAPPRPPLVTAPGSFGPRIAALGGGTGLPAVVEGLCDRLRLWDEDGSPVPASITAIVTMTDDGGSSGRLRSALGVLPPGDVRNCVLAGTRRDSPYRALLQHRFAGGSELEGHAVGNLLLAMMSQVTGSFPDAVRELTRLVDSRIQVLPASADSVALRAEFAGGVRVDGESAIVSRRRRIETLSLRPAARPLPEALASLIAADAIVVGPGSLYTSILPALMVQGIAGTIYGLEAARIYVANLMTQPGETDGFSLDDHLRVIRQHTGFDLFDYVLVNRGPMDSAALLSYSAQGAVPVTIGAAPEHLGRAKLFEADLACEVSRHAGKLRHEPRSLADAILRIIQGHRRDAPRMTTA